MNTAEMIVVTPAALRSLKAEIRADYMTEIYALRQELAREKLEALRKNTERQRRRLNLLILVSLPSLVLLNAALNYYLH